MASAYAWNIGLCNLIVLIDISAPPVLFSFYYFIFIRMRAAETQLK